MPSDTLKRKLSLINHVFGGAQILDLDTNPQAIAHYYHLNRLAYWLVVSRQGFVHMGLSEDAVVRSEDFLKPAKEISKYIQKARVKNVLELACGKGANLEYLAKTHPDVRFEGLDLPKGQTNQKKLNRLSNVFFQYGDYHDLARYSDDSQDLVFIVEALCYAQPKEKVIKEVYRVLKPGGRFVVYDGYNLKRYSEMTNQEAKAVRMGWKGMLVNPDDMHLGDFNDYLSKAGLKLIRDEDLGQAVLPSLNMLEGQAARFFRRPRLAKLLARLLPIHFTANTISGYVMPDVVQAGLCTYRLTVAQK